MWLNAIMHWISVQEEMCMNSELKMSVAVMLQMLFDSIF